MPNMQSIRTILWWSHSNLHPVCSIWANDRIYFLKCLEFSIFKIPPELVCMILQPYYEWWSILLSYYDSVTHSNQICQRIGFGKWLPSKWLPRFERSRGFLLEGDLTVAIRWEGPLGSNTVFGISFHRKCIIFASFVQAVSARSHWCQSMALSGNVEELDLSVLGPGGEVMLRVPQIGRNLPCLKSRII